MDINRLRHVVRKEFIRVRRDPATLRLLFIAPVLQLMLFGYAATNDVNNVAVGVYDGDHTPETRLLLQEIDHNYYFRIVRQVADPRELEHLLAAGDIAMGLNIPPEFARRMKRGETAQVGLYLDATDANTAGVASSYMVGLLGQRNLRWQTENLRRQGVLDETAPSVVPVQRTWYNPDLKSRNYMVPGVFGLILLTVTLNLASLAIVQEKETGTFEQLMVTPLRPAELIIGKMLPMAAIAVIEAGTILLLALGWFHVPFRGDLGLLFVISALFLVCSLSMGLLISAYSHTQQEAQILGFLVNMPSILLSGFMFPIQNMPVAVQYLTYLIPFRYFLEIVRGMFLKGVGLQILWPQVLSLALFAVVLVASATWALRRDVGSGAAS